MSEMIDSTCQVRIKDDYEVLFIGTMNECERWIHTDGRSDVTYEIEIAEPLHRRKKNEYDYASRI